MIPPGRSMTSSGDCPAPTVAPRPSCNRSRLLPSRSQASSGRLGPNWLPSAHRHVYTLQLDAEANLYQILIDGEEAKAGSILHDFDPPFVPPELIDDPTDAKPQDWSDEPEIAAPGAVKPADCDDEAPPIVDDLDAEMPRGWLEDEPQTVRILRGASAALHG